MQKNAEAERGWLAPAVIGVGLITLARVVALAFNRTDLFVDEAQYWLWGQELAFGYYSKPPMIGWVIRAATELGGSDAAFWIRLPAPLFHAATSLILGALAFRLYGRRIAILTALAFVTLPMVSLASVVIATDTILFPFYAAALFFYMRNLSERAGRDAALAGLFLGLAFLSKYAAFYGLIGGALAALFLRDARPSLRHTGLLLAAFLIAISPNIIWNALNGFSTAEHTLDNANWVRDPSARVQLSFANLAEFFFAQFAVFGPILFGALLLAIGWARRHPEATLLIFALPPIALVCVQAVLSRANANWAAAAYLPALVLVIYALANRPRWLVASFVINGALALAIPLAVAFAPELKRDGKELLGRYLGRDELSQDILRVAKARELTTVVATHRSVLADLFHTGRDSGLSFRALAPEGRAPHHYALKFPYQAGEAPVLFVTLGDAPPCDHDVAEVINAASGSYSPYTVTLYEVPGTCWSTP